MDAEALELVKKSTTCPECNRQFSSNEEEVPKTLAQCGHSFCRRCLIKMKYGTKIMCPLDYKTTECDYVSELPVNQDIMEAIKQLPTQEPKPAKNNRWALDSRENILIPANFYGVNDYETDAVKSVFGTVQVNFQGNIQKAVYLIVVDEPPISNVDFSINPIDLEGISTEFYEGLEKARFCWRWGADPSGSPRLITIENDDSIETPLTRVHKVTTQALKGDQAFRDALKDTKFNWRYCSLNGVSRKVLTIERVNHESVPN